MKSILSSKKLGFFKGRYNVLLIGLIILFIFRPYDRTTFYLGIWKLLLTANILAVIFNCKHSKNVRIAEISIAIPTVLFCWWDLIWDQPWSLIATSFLSVFFTFLSTFSIIIDILVRPKVTFETLRGVVCAYFLLGIGFAYLYWFLEWLSPGSFLITNQTISVYSYAEYISEMFYFSFVTLLTLGFGDIVPLKDTAQTAVIFEAIIGQFYIALLVARLVSGYATAHLTSKKD